MNAASGHEAVVVLDTCPCREPQRLQADRVTPMPGTDSQRVPATEASATLVRARPGAARARGEPDGRADASEALPSSPARSTGSGGPG
jgi:hypothetical protein